MNVSFVFRYFRSINSSDIITNIPTPLLKMVSSESKFIRLADCSSINYVNIKRCLHYIANEDHRFSWMHKQRFRSGSCGTICNDSLVDRLGI